MTDERARRGRERDRREGKESGRREYAPKKSGGTHSRKDSR